MIFKGDNPTDFPHLESFIDWLYEHVEELPSDFETLKERVLHPTLREEKEELRKDVDGFIMERAEKFK